MPQRNKLGTKIILPLFLCGFFFFGRAQNYLQNSIIVLPSSKFDTPLLNGPQIKLSQNKLTKDTVDNFTKRYTFNFNSHILNFQSKYSFLDAAIDINYVSIADILNMLYNPFVCYENQIPVYNGMLSIQLLKQDPKSPEFTRYKPFYSSPLTFELNGSKLLPTFVSDTILEQIDSLTLFQLTLQTNSSSRRIGNYIYFLPVGSKFVPDTLNQPTRVQFNSGSYIRNVPIRLSELHVDSEQDKSKQFSFKVIENVDGTIVKLDTMIQANKELFKYYSNKKNTIVQVLDGYRTLKRYVGTAIKKSENNQAIYPELEINPKNFHLLNELEITTNDTIYFEIGNLRINDISPVLDKNYFHLNLSKPWTTICDLQSYFLISGVCFIKTEKNITPFFFDSAHQTDLVKYISKIEGSYSLDFRNLVVKDKLGRVYSLEKSFVFRVFG
jgi:hypothetical protein